MPLKNINIKINGAACKVEQESSLLQEIGEETKEHKHTTKYQLTEIQ